VSKGSTFFSRPYEARKGGSPNAVVLDPQLPNMDGATMLRRSDPDLRAISGGMLAIEEVGLFWVVVNQPPVGGKRR